MSTYAIGDIQGSYLPFRELLEKVEFDPAKDTLWLAGDLVNRGPDSLRVMEYLLSIDSSVIAVLGNHDLHWLAVAYGSRSVGRHDTLQEVMKSPRHSDYLDWLRQQKLLHTDPILGYTMVHAGIPPQWSLENAQDAATELEQALQSDSFEHFLANMYGNQPNSWKDNLEGDDRLRLITNYFTRMRFCDAEGNLELETKTPAEEAPNGYLPWFKHPHRKTLHDKILFGHWAALNGVTHEKNVFALDTGCAWGGKLTAMRLEDGKLFNCDCQAI